MFKRLSAYGFMFSELVKRDFKKRYKGTILGVAWSMLAPLMQLAVMNIVFKQIFGRTQSHWVIYLFTGNLLFQYFRESTTNGMMALQANSNIFSKVNVPKYLFLLSRNVEAIINFIFSLIVYFVFVALDDIPVSWTMCLIVFPILCEITFNIGMGLILSALHIFFKDLMYLYNVICLLLMYLSAIFYYIDVYPESMQHLFYVNPIYCYITYMRQVVIAGTVPPLWLHGLCVLYALAFLLIGAQLYKKLNYKFLYYV